MYKKQCGCASCRSAAAGGFEVMEPERDERLILGEN
jgi:hypothetical protein